MGTESNSGFKNVTISNIVIRPSKVTGKSIEGTPKGHTGIALEEVDGGVLEGVVISNIRMDGPACPIFIRLGNRARSFDENLKIDHVGALQDISISNIIATGAKITGCSITGIPGYPVRNISLSHISIECDGGGTSEDYNRQVPEKEKSYPEYDMFDVLPSYGFYVRHAENIHFNDIQLITKDEDLRPAIFLSDARDGNLNNLLLSGCSKNKTDICLEKSVGIRISNCIIKGSSNSLLNFRGEENSNITVINNDLTNVNSLYVPDQKPMKGFREYGNIK